MELHPEQIAKGLITESFNSRRMVVAIFVIVNAAMLTAGLLWPKGYTASTSILVDERTIIQPLMQGAAVATDALDRSRNAREVIFGRKIMDIALEHGGWLKTQPSVEERELLIEGIKKRTVISTVGKNILRIEYQDVDPMRALRVTEKFAELFMQESIAAKAAESGAAFAFIEKQTQEYQDKLASTEQELKELRSSSCSVLASLSWYSCVCFSMKANAAPLSAAFAAMLSCINSSANFSVTRNARSGSASRYSILRMFFPTVLMAVRILICSIRRSRSSTLGVAFNHPPYSRTRSMILRPKITSRAFLLRSRASVATAAPCISGWMMFLSSTRMLVDAV